MYARRQVCELTGIDEARFKALAHREQLPTIPPSVVGPQRDRDDAHERGWNKFSSFEVIQLALAERLMCQIGYADGLRPDTAAKMASQCGAGIEEMLSRRRGPDVWIGYVGQPVKPGGYDGGWNVHGTVFQIAKRVAEVAENDGPAERLFLVNASEVMRTIEARAAESGIPFPNDETIEQE